VNLELVPKGSCVKCFIPSLALLGGHGSLKRWRPVEGSWSFELVPLKVILGSWFLPFSLLPGPEVRWFFPYCALLWWCAILPQTQKKWGLWLWTVTSKSISQNKPFLFISWLSQVFVIVRERDREVYCYLSQNLRVEDSGAACSSLVKNNTELCMRVEMEFKRITLPRKEGSAW
jgi:hypothetical protein